jgi:hypothetical protein
MKTFNIDTDNSVEEIQADAMELLENGIGFVIFDDDVAGKRRTVAFYTYSHIISVVEEID